MHISMGERTTGFLKLMSKKLAAMISLIVLLLLFLTATVFFMSKANRDEYTLIDVFGRQRMLTQQLSKYANQKYALMQSMNDGNGIDTKEDISEKMKELDSSMEKAIDDFEKSLSSLKSGYMSRNGTRINMKASLVNMTSVVEDKDKLWQEFRQALEVLMNKNQIDEEATKALTFINANNEQLLKYSDDVTQSLINFHKKESGTKVFIALSLFAAALIVLLVLVIQSYKYIVIPLSDLYSSFSNIGYLKKGVKVYLPRKSELVPVVQEIETGLEKLNKLIDLINNMNQDISFEGILKYIYDNFSEFIPYEHIGIALLKDDGETVEASFGISDGPTKDLPKKLLGIKARLEDTSLGDVVKKGKPRVINDLEAYTKHRDAIYNKILIEAGIKSSITLPLSINNKPVGIIFFSSTKRKVYKEEHIDFLSTLSSSIAISLNKNIFIDELIYSAILALAKLAESRDEYTGDHLERMKQYSAKITEFLLRDNIYNDEISVGFVKDIERFSPMHDIGKVGVSDEILLKPGKLTEQEFEEMKKHTIYGAEVLKAAEKHMRKRENGVFEMGIEIAENHHERWDGTGYPNKKAGTEIPLSARIVAVADVFDALTSERPYKKAFSFEDSLSIILDGKGTHFDPNIVDSLVKHKDEMYELYKTFQDND